MSLVCSLFSPERRQETGRFEAGYKASWSVSQEVQESSSVGGTAGKQLEEHVGERLSRGVIE